MFSIPQDLIDRFQQDEIVLFIGDELDHHFQMEHLISTLGLTNTLGQNETSPFLKNIANEFDDVRQFTQAYEDEYGRSALHKFLKIHLDQITTLPEPYHLIAHLAACNILVTTNYHTFLEQALGVAARPFNLIIGNQADDLPDEPKTQLYKLFGSLSHFDTLIVTEDDYHAFLGESSSFPVILRGHMARKTHLFIGHPPTDNFKRLYRKLLSDVDQQATQNYIIWPHHMTAATERWCRRFNLEVIACDSLAFLQSLQDELVAKANMAHPQAKVPLQPPSELHRHPYKLLHYYEAKDAGIFFGRRKEIQLLSSLVDASRLILFFGASGAGKTSLLLAGISPILERESYQLVYIRSLENPAWAIRRAIQHRLAAQSLTQQPATYKRQQRPFLRQMINQHFDIGELKGLCFDLDIEYENIITHSGNKQDAVISLLHYCERHDLFSNLIARCQQVRPNLNWSKELSLLTDMTLHKDDFEDMPLVNLLDIASQQLNTTLVIVLDQFEEFFIGFSPELRESFILELRQICYDHDVAVKVVLSFREDVWPVVVDEIEKYIPEVNQNRYRLRPLNPEQARQAIELPLHRYDIHYEAELIDKLLEDLVDVENGRILPPQLQLVCSALYNTLPENEHIISLANYQLLGGSSGVLRRYLQEELSGFVPEKRGLAQRILEELVTSQATKTVKTSYELAHAIDVPLDELEAILARFVRSRLLRMLELEDGSIAFELAHEYLVQEIDLMSETVERKRVEELIKREVENRHTFENYLIGSDNLAIISEGRRKFKLRLNQEATELINLSIENQRNLEENKMHSEDSLRQASLDIEQMQELIQSSKMAALGQLVAGVAHEINTPAGSIHSNSYQLAEIIADIQATITDFDGMFQPLLEDETQLAAFLSPEELATGASKTLFQKLIKHIVTYIQSHYETNDLTYNFEDISDISGELREASNRIKSIVMSLANFTRLDEAERKKVDIHEGLEATLSLLHHELKYQVIVEREYGDLPDITCYPNELNQVFMNILTNAIQALQLDTLSADEKGIIRIKTYPENQWGVIAISDTGKGIPPEHLDKMFEPFFSTKGAAVAAGGLGLGLGLPISQKIIEEKHSGKIEVSSRVGEGTTFYIKLPVDQPDLDAHKPARLFL